MPAECKLNWAVQRDNDGKIVRRVAEGDTTGMQQVDVVWTHTDGFKPHKLTVPATFDFRTQKTTYEEIDDGEAPKEVKDQLTVSPAVSDSTIAAMLDEKRARLAENLGVSQ